MALAISVWLLKEYFKHAGPTIQITFDDASGLQAQKTQLRFRGVVVGVIKKIEISSDNKDVVAFVSLHKDVEQFAVEGSKFWIVAPKVNFQGVSGLETLFEGTYISVQPGPPDGEIKTTFRGRIGSESTDPLEDTSGYVLETNNVESVNEGDNITFRGLKVGSVTKVTLAKNSQALHVQINIQNRYTKLVRTNTVFWRKVAVQAKLGLFNSELKINSLDTMLHGGIEFFTPNEVGPKAKALSHFPLLTAQPKDSEQWNPAIE